MPANRPGFINQLLEMWSHLQWRQRFSVIGSGILGLALISAVVYFMNRVPYEALYRDLNPEDANAIVAKLKDQKKKYVVEGNSIMVAAPRNEIDELRMEISGSGLGRSGKIGYEIFDKNQFGMTDFTEQINLQRALEGELSRTIGTLSEISQARVHIVLPKDSYFEETKADAKASVVLTLKKGAVPGLNTHSVSIIDEEGRLLSQSVESGESARAEMESGIREQLEKEMSGKVISILEPRVGKGKVQAIASIDLDFNTTEQTEETFNPNPPVVLSQQKSEERSGGVSGNAGIPGTASNVGPAAPQISQSVPERVRQSEVTNYEVNKLFRHTVQPKGSVRRLSVAVILDNKTVWTKTKNGKETSRSEPRSPNELNSCRELVLAAIGYNTQRGDVVTIENVAFYSDLKPEEPVPATPWYYKWQTQTYLLPGMKYGAFLILFLLAYLLLFRPFRKQVFHAISAASPGSIESGAIQLVSENAPRALSGTAQPEEIASGAATASLTAGEFNSQDEVVSLEAVSDEQIERDLIREANTVDMGNRKYAAMKKKLVDKAKREPEMVSQLVRTLLKEKA
jgi:flagellar M-ring protein FliF